MTALLIAIWIIGMPVFYFLTTKFSKESDELDICFISFIWPFVLGFWTVIGLFFGTVLLPKGLFMFLSSIPKWFTFLKKLRSEKKKDKPKKKKQKDYKDLEINDLEQYRDLKKAVDKFTKSLGRHYG